MKRATLLWNAARIVVGMNAQQEQPLEDFSPLPQLPPHPPPPAFMGFSESTVKP